MLSSCEFLLEFTARRSVDDYANDRSFRSAVERELQIIGEALLQLQRVAREVARRIPEHENIIGFRHVLVHGYNSLKPATVWNVVEDKLPTLRKEVQSLLEKRAE